MKKLSAVAAGQFLIIKWNRLKFSLNQLESPVLTVMENQFFCMLHFPAIPYNKNCCAAQLHFLQIFHEKIG
jgi:hypothetical protein